MANDLSKLTSDAFQLFLSEAPLGASRPDVISAILTGLPAAGMAVVTTFPAVMRALDLAENPT
jgi:hypothetical protein